MGIRLANHVHFVQAVKNGIVEKILNVDFRGRPGLVFKALKDIYESEDTNVKFDSDVAKVGRMCSAVEENSKKRGIDSRKFVVEPENEEESDLDDINFGKITLKQLKKQNKVKRRKTTHVYTVTVNEEFDDSPTEKDETGLNETISSWKSKKPKGNKRSSKEFAQTSSSVKSVEVEVSETKYSEPVVTITEACDSFVICSEQVMRFSGKICSENIEDVENDSQPENELSLTNKSEQVMGFSGEICSENIKGVENDSQPENELSLTDKSESCAVNGICYDHLKDNEEGVTMERPEMTYTQLTDSPISENEESATWISVPEEDFLETTFPVFDQSSDLHTSDCESNDNYENMPLDLRFDPLSSPQKNSSSSLVSTYCSNYEINLVCEEDDLFSSRDPVGVSLCTDTETEYSPEESSVVPRKVSATDNAESDSPDLNKQCDSVSEDSVSKTGNHNLVGIRHPPERLLSTRKVISPVSQQKLCQAMRGVESIDNKDHYKCKGKLQFENATGYEPSTKEQGAKITKLDTSVQDLGALGRSRVTIKPKRNTIKKNSPPKTRSLPNFSTGTRSIQKLSESAIAFSQRQMHDFESLATKLMLELNSMNDIVEQKLYPETSLMSKYDVNQVKLAVKSAKKAEETTRKWLSMMARDCSRFCTIMKLSEKGEVPSPDKGNKERRKVSFADEAGGVLCHVKIIEDCIAGTLKSRNYELEV